MPERPWEPAFLEGLRLRGQRQIAADFAGVALRTVRRHEEKDEMFRQRCRDARRAWVDSESERRVQRVRRMLRRTS